MHRDPINSYLLDLLEGNTIQRVRPEAGERYLCSELVPILLVALLAVSGRDSNQSDQRMDLQCDINLQKGSGSRCVPLVLRLLVSPHFAIVRKLRELLRQRLHTATCCSSVTLLSVGKVLMSRGGHE